MFEIEKNGTFGFKPPFWWCHNIFSGHSAHVPISTILHLCDGVIKNRGFRSRFCAITILKKGTFSHFFLLDALRARIIFFQLMRSISINFYHILKNLVAKYSVEHIKSVPYKKCAFWRYLRITRAQNVRAHPKFRKFLKCVKLPKTYRKLVNYEFWAFLDFNARVRACALRARSCGKRLFGAH